MAGTMHPYLLSGGRVAETTKWMTHGLPYIYNNGSVNYPTTLGNMWVLQDIDQRGGDPTTLYGGHHNKWTDKATKKLINFKALHYIGERKNKDVCATNYYRANNLGLGDIICFPLMPRLLEGPAPKFLPTGIYTLAAWSTSDDSGAGRIDRAKISFAEGLPDGQMMLSVGKGWCSTVAWDKFKTPAIITARGKIGCDVGIYSTTKIPSMVMGDLVTVVDDPAWHEFGARLIAPRTIGPAGLINSENGSCLVMSSDAGSTDAYPIKPYNFNSGDNMKAAANNGTQVAGLDHAEVVAIRFYEVVPNTRGKSDTGNAIGNRVRLMGDVPLLADRSFKAQVPCDQPYFMVGIDSKGRAVKRDQLPQSVRPGEWRICTGCHLHGKAGRPPQESLAFTAQPHQIMTSAPVPSYDDDVLPILVKRCRGCHVGENQPPLFTYDDLVWDFFQKKVPPANRVQTGPGTYGLDRPQASKYVHTQFARESLLYWKAANERTDGRTDGSYSDDIDFGPNHPSTITADEVKVIAEWIDSGSAKTK
jgi:Hydrazine synthase alpha subunit middle domain